MPTQTILKSIVAHLARRDAPVDAKEVAESIEFYLRSGKRLLGAASRVLANQRRGPEEDGDRVVTVYDLCAGHGLTGLLFAACNPPGRRADTRTRAVLVDRVEPPSHAALRDCVAEVCPWVAAAASFDATPLEDFAPAEDGAAARRASVVVATHACGALTDRALEHAVGIGAAAVAAMPCCYTGTDGGAPYGVRRLLGPGLAADVRRSFYLQERGYLADFAAIPRAVTPMNRILVAERRQ